MRYGRAGGGLWSSFLALACLCEAALLPRAIRAQQTNATLVEEIRSEEPVGASQLALRAFVLHNGAKPPMKAGLFNFSIAVPASVAPASIVVEIRDDLDKGYYMRVGNPCRGSRPCDYSWPDAKVVSAGLKAADLWAVARPVDAADVLLPLCFCKSQELARNTVARFTLVPIRAVNLAYSLYRPDGTAIASGNRDDFPARSPLTLEFDLSDPKLRGKELRLVINHIAASGSSAERFADVYAFVVP